MKVNVKNRLSFEFFPPKTSEGIVNLEKTAAKLATFSPDFFSVTYGAGGSTREGTINTVKALQQQTHTPIVPHLSCIGSTKKETIEIINIYQTLGVKQIIALRGDLPSGMGQPGELVYASDLVALIRQSTQDFFNIMVAAYPEFHPQAKSAHDDILNLKKKVDAGANSAITQYFFNPDAYFNFLDQCAKQSIFIPITPGIMPITNFSKLVRFSDCCGAEIPRWIRKRLESYADDDVSIKKFGLEVIYNLCENLLRGGAEGLHIYTLNHFTESQKLLALLSEFFQKKTNIENNVNTQMTEGV